MEELLNKLYSYEYFSVYLIMSIIVLIILFIIILFYGKKDKKKREIEATKKLQQINGEDAFKEESEMEKVEVNNMQEQLENDTIIVPAIEDISENQLENETAVVNEIPEPIKVEEKEEIENTFPNLDAISPNEITIDNNEEEPIKFGNVELNDEEKTSPIFERIEEKPFVFNETEDNYSQNNATEEETKEEKEESAIELTPVEEVEAPVFSFEQIARNTEELKNEEAVVNSGSEVFSSVYALPKEDVEPIAVPSKEELDFELPMLKKEAKEEDKKEEVEMPVLNDYNLDELSGETYTINK